LFPLFATGVNDTGGKFATGVIDTGGNLPPASLTPAANLPPVSLAPVANWPPVSTTQAELVAKFAAGVVDTGGKFAAGVADTRGNLPPVSLTPVVNLDLRISLRQASPYNDRPAPTMTGQPLQSWEDVPGSMAARGGEVAEEAREVRVVVEPPGGDELAAGWAAMPVATGSVRPAGLARVAPVATATEAMEGREDSATKKVNWIF
jgi:hypothetical protein